MEIRNIWKNVTKPLEIHTDDRGAIVDVFYQQNIQHVAVIRSEDGVVRGNHYHKATTQHYLMTRGSMEYWHKPVDSDKPAVCQMVTEGDLLTTPPDEIHALKMIGSPSEFIVFTTGKRGGKDYESDTFRIPSIIPE